MGLFQHKKKSNNGSSDDDTGAIEERFFDENFREELRNHGRWYFEKIITENGDVFKKELDTTVEQISIQLKEHVIKQLDITIEQVNIELKDHVTKRLDEQFLEYSRALKDAQDLAMQSLNRSAQALEEQHHQISATLEENVKKQETELNAAFEENKAHIASMKDAQNTAMESLNRSAQALEEQHNQLNDTLKSNVAKQEEVLVTGFESNMAQIVEHYLLGALGNQYDMKAQIPSIIQELEANKKAIVDDMKL